jgi:4-hydroxybutyrate CoA-transferase
LNWLDVYKSKVMSADEAVRHVKSGETIVMAHAAGESPYLGEALVRNAALYKNVTIVQLVNLCKADYCKAEYKENFHYVTPFLSGAQPKKAVAEGHADFMPVFFHQVPALIRERFKPEVLMAQVSLPDEHGYCSFGVSSDFTWPTSKIAKKVIVQVNKYMPRTLGQIFIHVDNIDCIVEHDEPLIEIEPSVLGEVERAIGKHCASLVRDGDCLQLGIGGIPDAVLASLTDKSDLGIYTEMFSDGTVDLIRAGNVNNKKKNFHPGVSVSSFLIGTHKLYDFVDNNPAVEMYPVDYVNDPRIACQNDDLVSINSCVQVDLMGQVVSDAIGFRQISGVGGQVDFVRAAAMSRGGKSIIALASTAKGISKIVPFVDQGAAATTSRFDEDYVVTEYGAASLKWKTLKERARELIGIAHPDHRGVLIEEYEKRFLGKF